MKKTKKDVFDNPRAMAKLFKEAGRVKNILSANIDHYAQVENLIDEQDFRLQVPSNNTPCPPPPQSTLKNLETQPSKGSNWDSLAAERLSLRDPSRIIENLIRYQPVSLATNQTDWRISSNDIKMVWLDQVSREELEKFSSDLLERVPLPIEQALAASKMTMDEISHIIIVGAGTRMPKVQEILTKFTQRELGKNLNADEAAALGAIYRAADHSAGFQVKKFLAKDAVVFPIEVSHSTIQCITPL